MLKYIGKPLKLFVFLIVLYSLLLIIVFIPNPDRLTAHIDSVVTIIEEEGTFRQPGQLYSIAPCEK